MNKFTEALWEVLDEALDDDEQLLADLKTILLKEYKPFLTTEPSLQQEVNIHSLKSYFLDKFNQWVNWLPGTTINILGTSLAEEALSEIYWSTLAILLQERFTSVVS